jgi:hypothetical protein
MTRIKSAGIVAAAMAAMGGLVGGAGAAMADSGGATASESSRSRGCTGTWDAQVDRGSQVPALKIMVTMHADGTAIVSGAAAQASSVPGGADVEFNSAGLGAWQAKRDGCVLRVKTLSNDITGRDSGSAVVEASLRLGADSRSFSGTASLRTSLPEGGGSGADGLRVTGSRFTVSTGAR